MASSPNVSRQRRWQMRHQSLGLCMLCSAKAVTKNYCEKHAAAMNERMRARYQARGANPTASHTCGRCGKIGHNARTCDRRRAVSKAAALDYGYER